MTRPGEWIQGLWPARHDDPTYDPDLRVIPLGVAVDTRQRDNLGVPIPAPATLGTMHATMAFIPADPASPRSIGAWSAAFPLVARAEGKSGGIALRARAGIDLGTYDGADETLADLLDGSLFREQRSLFDRHILPGDEALGVGTTELPSRSAYDAGLTLANAGSGAPYVLPIGNLPLALPLARDAAALADYTTTAKPVTMDRGKPVASAVRLLLSGIAVAPESGAERLSINGTRATGGLIDLDLAGGTATVVRGALSDRIATHRLPAVIVGGVGILDPHGDAAHMSCDAPFIALDDTDKDGPLAFERGYDDGAREGTIPHRVHRRFERASGRWVDHVTVPVYQDDDPPDGPPKPPPEDPRDPGEPEVPPPVPPETPGVGGLPPGIPDPRTPPLPPPGTEDPFPPGTGGLIKPLPFDPFNPPRKGRGEGAVESSYARPSAGSPHEWHAPGIAFRATPTAGAGQGGDFRAPRGRMSAAQVARARSAPISLHIEGYGAETDGGRFVATGNRGAASRRYAYAEGTAGGAVVLPPEIGLEHIRDLTSAYASEAPSVQYLAFVPTYARLAFGTPDVSGLGVKSGFGLYQDGVAGSLRIDAVDSAGTATQRAAIRSDGGVTVGSVTERRYGDGPSDVFEGTALTTLLTATIPEAALTQGTRISVLTSFEKTTSVADSFWALYLNGVLVSSATAADITGGGAFTSIALDLFVQKDGASGRVNCHTRQTDSAAATDFDVAVSTAVALNAACALDLRVSQASASDDVRALGWTVIVETPA